MTNTPFVGTAGGALGSGVQATGGAIELPIIGIPVLAVNAKRAPASLSGQVTQPFKKQDIGNLLFTP